MSLAGFSMPDLITVALIKQKLQFLSENPHHVEFILCPLNSTILMDYVGKRAFVDALNFITNNRIRVTPYYETDLSYTPSIAVISSGGEKDQFIGEYAGSYVPTSADVFRTQNVVFKPSIFASFNALEINKSMMKVSNDYDLINNLWYGSYITNGVNEAVIKGFNKKDEYTELCLDRELPEDALLVGWKAQSSPRKHGFNISSSSDEFSIECQLSTSGDPAVHRILSILLRYCIKSQVVNFSNYGLNNISINYSPMIPFDSTDKYFQSNVTIRGQNHDFWIASEYELNDPYGKIEVGVTAVSTPPNEPVKVK